MRLLLLAVVLFLAWSNGGNDTFKGVATLYGSGTTSYRTALGWALATTALGALLAKVLSAGLIAAYSAQGLFSAPASPALLGAAALGGALTVLVATRLGLPVSTTHALTGALIGAGWMGGLSVNFSLLGRSFVLPLLLSPVLAMAAAAALYPLCQRLERALGLARNACVCVGEGVVASPSPGGGAAVAQPVVGLVVATEEVCAEQYPDATVSLTARRTFDGVHFLSAGAVCFARALNDGSKFVGAALGAAAAGVDFGIAGVALAMCLGGALHSRRVAETMAKGVVELDPGRGLVANLTTAALVLGASRFGLPVSTTHVATGGLFGIGAVTGGAKGSTIRAILLAWGTTLPLGAALGAGAALLAR